METKTDIKRVKRLDPVEISEPIQVEPVELPMAEAPKHDIVYYGVPRESGLERILKTLFKTLAGENGAGKVLARIKNIIAPWVPFGTQADQLTDIIGDELKHKQKKDTNMNWIKQRLTEKSTWRGAIVAVTAVLGFAITPELKEAIVTAGVALFTVVEIAFSDDGKKNK